MLRVEQGDAVVVPAHPLGLVLVGAGSDRRVVADDQSAGLRGHVDDRHGVVLLIHRVVDEVLVEAAVLHRGRECELAFDVFGQAETVADQLRTARLDGVVVGQHAVMPDLVDVVQFALGVDEAIGEGVGGGIEIAVGLNEAALGEGLAGAVLDREVDPGFIEVALLGDEGVGDALVLDDDVGDEGVAGGDGEIARGREERRGPGSDGGSVLFSKREDIDVENSGALGAILEECDELFGLLVVLVVDGNQGVAAQPAVAR